MRKSDSAEIAGLKQRMEMYRALAIDAGMSRDRLVEQKMELISEAVDLKAKVTSQDIEIKRLKAELAKHGQ